MKISKEIHVAAISIKLKYIASSLCLFLQLFLFSCLFANLLIIHSFACSVTRTQYKFLEFEEIYKMSQVINLISSIVLYASIVSIVLVIVLHIYLSKILQRKSYHLYIVANIFQLIYFCLFAATSTYENVSYGIRSFREYIILAYMNFVAFLFFNNYLVMLNIEISRKLFQICNEITNKELLFYHGLCIIVTVIVGTFSLLFSEDVAMGIPSNNLSMDFFFVYLTLTTVFLLYCVCRYFWNWKMYFSGDFQSFIILTSLICINNIVAIFSQILFYMGMSYVILNNVNEILAFSSKILTALTSLTNKNLIKLLKRKYKRKISLKSINRSKNPSFTDEILESIIEPIHINDILRDITKNVSLTIGFNANHFIAFFKLLSRLSFIVV
jgi:hypothetical protein